MTIYILDYASGNVVRIHANVQTRKLIEKKYKGDVESYLNEHEKHFGIRMKDCYFMAVEGETTILDFNMI